MTTTVRTTLSLFLLLAATTSGALAADVRTIDVRALSGAATAAPGIREVSSWEDARRLAEDARAAWSRSSAAGVSGDTARMPGDSITRRLDPIGRAERLIFAGNTDLWVHGHHAYMGTFQSPCGDGTGENGSGVRIYDVRNPHDPHEVSHVPSVVGARCNDVKVAAMNSGDVLVHSNEQCAMDGPGGVEVWNVDDPLNPVYLSSIRVDDINPLAAQFGFSDVGVHNLWLFSQGNRDYVAVVALTAFGNFQIFDITDPTAPTFAGAWGPEFVAFPDVDWYTETDQQALFAGVGYIFSGAGASAHKLLHDVTMTDDGKLAYLSNWDAGLVLLDVSDPGDPVPISIALDPTAEDGEINSHAAWHTADGRVVVETEEDFAPLSLVFEITSGPVTGEVPAQHLEFSGPVPPGGLAGSTVYVGTGCPGDDGVPTASGEGEFALTLLGDCPLNDAEAAARKAGYEAIVFFPDASGQVEVTINGPLTLPAFFVPHEAALLIAGAADMSGLVVGEPGESIATSVVPDGWGMVRIWDYSDPASPVLASTLNTPCGLDPLMSECDPRGVYSVHNVIVEDDLAYISWYAEGVFIYDISDPYAPMLRAHWNGLGAEFEAQNGGIQDVWGIYKVPNRPWIYASDRNGGLYILKERGQGNEHGQGNGNLRESAARPATLELVGAHPARSGHVVLGLAVETSSPVTAEIFDVTGRRLAAIAIAAGERRIEWNGRTDTGSRAPAGSYWVRVPLADGTTATQRVVLTR